MTWQALAIIIAVYEIIGALISIGVLRQVWRHMDEKKRSRRVRLMLIALVVSLFLWPLFLRTSFDE